MSLHHRIPNWIDVIWLSLLAIYVLAGTALTPFHGDESTVIYMGRDFYYHFVDGDMEKVLYDDTWSISATEQHIRLLNGTIPKYLFGWVAWATGHNIEDINGQWDWTTDYRFNDSSGRIPIDDILLPSRTVSAIQLALAISIFFGISRWIFNRPIAYLASLYLVLNPAILINGRRAMMEGSLLLTIMLVILAGLLLLRHRKWYYFAFLGLVSGLAFASKHPAIFVISLTFFACSSYLIIGTLTQHTKRSRNVFKFLGGLILSGLLAFSVFYSLNPAWWGDPLNRAREVLDFRNDLLSAQGQQYGSYEGIDDRINGMFEYAFVAQPQYFEVASWSLYSQIMSQIETYEQSPWSGLAIGGSQVGGFILLVLTVLGTIHLARNQTIASDSRWLLLFWGVGMFIITIALTPLGWQRYYLSLYPVVALFSAYSVYIAASLIWKRFTT